VLVLNNDNATPGTLKFRAGSTIDVVFSGTGTSSATIDVSGAGSNKGRIDLNGSTRTFNIGSSSATVQMTINAIIMDGAGSSGITKTGAGTMALTGANLYVGSTTINDGALQLGNGGTTGSLHTSSAIIVTAPGVFAVNRSNTTTQGTDFSGGAITGTGGVTQNGSGTLVLNSANTYSGTTTINAGALQVDNTTGSGTGTGPVVVMNGAILQGTGTIAGDTTVNSGAQLQPGTSTIIGTLTFGNTLTLLDGSTTDFHLAGDTSFDKILTTNLAVGLTATSTASFRVFLDGLYSPIAGVNFKIFDWTSLTGADTNLANNLDFTGAVLGAGLGWDTSTFNSNGIISVMAIPEPGRVLMLMFGLTGLFMRRRRRD
jgi:autotransporter-associated beta strand protein